MYRKLGLHLVNEEMYFFSWDEIPGNDNGRLIDFLTKNLGIELDRNTKIEKIDAGKTIKVSTEKNSLSLKLNNDKSKVNLEIDGRPYEFIAKAENGKLNIYKELDLKKVKEDAICESEHRKVKECLKKDSPEAKKGRFILRREQFILHYFEVTSLRDIISEEINSNDSLISSLNGQIPTIVSLMITSFSFTLFNSPNGILPLNVFLTVITLLGSLLVINLIRHVWASIKLNEAKDVMYICLGIDVDNP